MTGPLTNASLQIAPEISATLIDPSAYADNRIHDAYRWLREHQPVGLATPNGYDPFWVITRHADIQFVARNNDLFHYGDRQQFLMDQQGDAMIRAVTGAPYLLRTLTVMDPPEHMKYRMLTQTWFSPRNIQIMENKIRTLARETVDRMLAKGPECEFVSEVALHYPLRVVMQILGVPPEDEALMLQLTQTVFAPGDTDLNANAELVNPIEIFMQSVTRISEYFEALAAQRRENPKDDLATVIALAQVDDRPLDRMEALGYYIIVATAGHDTTSASTAGALWKIAESEELFMRLKRDPSLLPAAMEEAIRWTTPVKTFMRTATQDVQVGGLTIAKGDWLMLCYASANRDEAVFDEPYTFRVDRKTSERHLAFGFGPHICLGQHLARMEMRILFEELLPRLKSVRLNGTPTSIQSCFVNGPKTVPILFEAA